jgi:hypothetical protein
MGTLAQPPTTTNPFDEPFDITRHTAITTPITQPPHHHHHIIITQHDNILTVEYLTPPTTK